MEAGDDKLKWLEGRINSSLRPRNEDLKNMLLNDENRLAFHEFLNNEDMRRLFVYIRSPRQIIASLQPPHDNKTKSIFFLKNNAGSKLNKENMDEEVMYFDCLGNPLEQMDMLTREVYLPLLCTDTSHANDYGISADRMMDVLHRLMATVETTQGYTEGEITLSLPSIEVLAEAAATMNRRGAVLHVLETTVIGWIKQIRGVLKHDPIEDIERLSGPSPGPLDEIELWSTRLDKLHSINVQLDSPVAQDILRNLEEANSTYAHSFTNVRRDIGKAILDTEENLMFLQTMVSWFEKLHICGDPQEMLKLFAPLTHTLLLVWTHAKYYHQPDKFHNMLRLISNEVVHRAEAMVGEDVLREPLESYSKLKDALRVCAAFRGTYLDYRDRAEEINEKNKQDHAEKLITRPEGQFMLFSTKMYGANAFTPRYGLPGKSQDEEEQAREEELWRDSPWPPRNATAFDHLNSFMERCNDVLELVQTTRHFRLLADTAEIGGAGTQSLDALVREIHTKYAHAMDEFFSQVSNVLAIDGSQTFEKAFFVFRTVVKDLERKLSEVLRQSFHQCPTIGSQLRLLEVFEGISSRELVQSHLKDKDRQLVSSFTSELIQVRGMFKANEKLPPQHKNMPPVVSKMLWIYGLKQRIELPMKKLKIVSPHSLEGDLGWHLRDAYSDAMTEIENFESRVINEWQSSISAELAERLKQPLLVADEFDEDEEIRPQSIHVNLDPHLLLLLREIHYLSQEPFNIALPAPARELLRNTNSATLRSIATRLETIVSKYNTVMRMMTEFEQPLFERCLDKIDLLFQQGLQQYTWRTEESADFIETATALVCTDLHNNLDIVQTNCLEISSVTLEWSQGTLDVFTAREETRSYDIEELIEIQISLNEEVEAAIVPGGATIHSLLDASFIAVHISEASPAWQDYVDYIDAIVLDGLKQACLVSLKSMLNQIVQSNMSEEVEDENQSNPAVRTLPILTIRLELIEKCVAFRPPLDQSTSSASVHETVQLWLEGFLNRGNLVPMLSNKGSYRDYIYVDEEVVHLLDQINRLVQENAEECKELFELFKDFAFLWQQDVNQTFEEFLHGESSPRDQQGEAELGPSNIRAMASARSLSRTSSMKDSIESAGLIGTAERSFLAPKDKNKQKEASIPSLDEFDAEIDVYRTARDEICSLQDYQDVGWLRVDLRPIKQVLTTYASKWMWTYTKYLTDQVTTMLDNLDRFLKRTEPEIESITGEERDTASFMKMMRLFNEVSAQQHEMDGKFAAMHRTVLLVKKYGQKLPDSTQNLFDAAPGRWNNLKTKVSLAKQRLGPRIQEENDSITKDLETFGEQVNVLQQELDHSEVYNRDCSLGDAWVMIDNFIRSLEVLENEAQDLIELQDLLEASVVNFAILPQCRYDLNSLREVWETVRVIDEQQAEWKRHRWQKMNTRFLREETSRQLDIVRALPDDVFTWDVYMGLHESITTIQTCLPLIDDLRNTAMRTRHWKQLVRVTGGALQIDNDTLKRMSLGELLSLGLQKHGDDVRAIVQRAVKDLIIEQSLKTYEEVWLSKLFELREHVRNRLIAAADKTTSPNDQRDDAQSEVSHQSEALSHQQGAGASRSQMRTTSRVSNQSSLGRTRRTSVSSLPYSLIQVGDGVEEYSPLKLLTMTDAMFEELESHQVALQTMQSSSAAGSFLDEVLKWQKRLQTVEAVVTHWLQVQEKWTELEEVYSTQEVRTAMSHDANTFAIVNRDFRLLMKATEKNPNVLQCCQRKNILTILEKMNWNLDICRKSLLAHLERRRIKFPRFYFLSMEDVLHIICNGYDVKQVNLYIGKLFENVGSLIYEDVEDAEKYQFQITGICSTLGEKLPFIDPVPCEGHIESWLSNFLSMAKASLQYQLATAMGTEVPQKKTRQIHSAGARRVTVQDRRSSRAPSREKSSSQPGSRDSRRLTSRGDNSSNNNGNDPQAPSEGGFSWTLDHTAEIVHLATQIRLTTQTAEALQQADSGNKQAIQEAIDAINNTLSATVLMLKGLEGEREKSRQDDTEEAPPGERERSETQSETQSAMGTRASQRGSALDVTAGGPQQSPIPEETQKTDGDNISTAEPTTVEKADTMDLSGIALFKKEQEQIVQERKINPAELRLVLFPSQIQKISSLIALIAHQRDLLQRLRDKQEESNQPIKDDFTWKSQLHYSFQPENKTVQINMLQYSFDYGFEYAGSAHRDVITPLTEKVFVSLTQAIRHHTGGLCVGEAGNGGLITVKELSHSLGKPLYTFNCSQKTDTNILYDIFKGFATTGSWICFNNINYVPAGVMSVLSSLLSTVMQAVRSGKTSLHLHTEELQLQPDIACFATLDSAVKVEAHDPEKLFVFNSAVSKLPKSLTSQFRVVGLVKPDLKLMVEVLLLSQGFQNGAELSHKIIILYDLCRQLIGTNTPLVNELNHLSYNCSDMANGWSRQTLKYISLEAGAILDQLTTAGLVPKPMEHIDHFPEEEEYDQEKQDAEKSEKGSVFGGADVGKHENEAVMTALRNTFMPRLKDRDASVFAQLLKDLWPEVQIPLSFGGQASDITERSDVDVRSLVSGHGASKSGSRAKSRSQMTPNRCRSVRDSLNLNTPVVQMASALGDNFNPDDEDKQVIGEIDDAIAVATSKLGLMPGAAFQARVSQLAQLNVVHKTIIVAGPAGCGKSECIKTFALAERERGKTVNVQSVFTKAYESQELLGHLDPNTKTWKDGLLPSLLRKFCLQGSGNSYSLNDTPVMKVMQLDGEFDFNQLEMMESILHNEGTAVLTNNERIIIPDTLRFIWETESLAQMSPSLLGNLGVLAMTKEDVSWAMILSMWLDRRRDSDRDLLKTLCDQYLPKTVDFLKTATAPPMFSAAPTGGLHMKRMIHQSEEGMVNTFTNILDAELAQFPDLSDVEVERFFNFAAIWSFAGTLEAEYRDSFSQWWKESFEQYIDFPVDGTVFDYLVDPETKLFQKWAETVPPYSGTPHEGLPPDAFVHTVNSEQLLNVLGLLTDYGCPVMLVGGNGCGKTSIINERIRTVCSGEVAEVLGLSITASRFTNAKLLYQRLDERLEWKHGKTHVPRGNKRLLFFIDDLNLAQTDEFHNQTAMELVRQHIDDGGFYNPEDHSWRYVNNVTYVTTLNPHPSANVPRVSPRLMRHFAVFGCPYPSHEEQQTIFSALLHTHFITPEMSSAVGPVDRSTAHHLGIQDEKVQNEIKEEEEALKLILSLMVRVTLELQEKLRLMFLPTADRCHYIFNMRDLSNVFRNLCLSLQPACSRDNLLLLWEHECYWVYGHRMINVVDYDRFRQAFVRAVRKSFTSDEHIQLLSKKEKPIFSNLMEQDSGLVTAGNIQGNTGSNQGSDEERTDRFKPVYNITETRSLMEHGVEEYNKTHPRIKLALYRTVMEQVCRLARVFASPHEVSHVVLVAEGCPGHTPVLVNLAAHLCGFSVFKINPSPLATSQIYNLDTFKAEIVSAYTRAGVKGERVLFLLEDDELIEEDFIVYLSEFIVSGSISHLFTTEEQTTIINSIRTEVTQAGLAYTRDVAWDFFLRTVKKNFRVCFVCSEVGTSFQRRCREYPNFTKNVNFLWFGHWSKKELIRHAGYHLRDLKWMSRVQKENVAHMLATMHLVARQQDGHEQGSGQYKHLTNLTYEKFVEGFINMADARHNEIGDTHQVMMKMMGQIQRENALATKLKRELEHECVVLSERKEGTIQILSQIGQDTAITEQQIKIVKCQMEKIDRLKKLLPEYQVAHERAVYKTVSIVSDTKKIVQNINLDSLSELRAMQKPVIDIEDLMAAIIMILKKNPQADLTWQKGAKRQMANLERFIEELLTFDEEVLAESTLALVEPYLKKPSFDPDSLERKTSNSACASLCKWVKGVCRYHRMMISKVKPLHNKVEETTMAIDNAEHKMNLLDNKRKALEVRLADLAKGFEEATIDKNEQEDKTNKMDKMLETAARLKKVLRREQRRIQQIIDSLPQREASICGGVAMAAAFASYLGPYHYNHRRLMLTVHWPSCLRERGIPLVIDSIDELKGRVVDWAIHGLKTASGASSTGISLEDIDEEDEDEDEEEELEQEVEVDEQQIQEKEEDADERDSPKQEEEEEEIDEEKKDEGSEKDQKEKMEKDQQEGEAGDSRGKNALSIVEEGGDEYSDIRESDGPDAPLPIITGEQYNVYIRSLIKLLVGETVLHDWLKKDFGPRQMENAAILYSSWQRPPMLIDPYGEGVVYLQWLNRKLNKKRLVSLDMDTRSDPQVIMAIERGIIRGTPLLLENFSEKIDSLIMPIIHHRNTALADPSEEESRMIKYCGRRILCHPDFRLYMTTTQPKPTFTPTVAATTSLINYGSSNDTIVDELLIRAFAKIRPELYKERRMALKSVHINYDALLRLWSLFKEQVHTSANGKQMLFDEKDVDVVADMTQKTVLLSEQLRDSRQILSDLDLLKEELGPLAKRAMKLFSVIRSLACVRREYQFPFPFFLRIFDQAIPGEFPTEFTEDSDDEPDYEEDESVPGAGKRRESHVSEQNQHDNNDDNKDDNKDGEYGDDFEKEDSATQPETTTEGPETTKEEEEEKMLFEMPDVPQLPSEGVEYAGLPDNLIKQMMDQLTSLVFQHVQKSLSSEDRLLFAAMLCLNIQEETQYFTEEEMSLLLQGNPGLGMQLSLADFDCDEEVPAWLPADKWEDMLAISVLPGPLDSLCVHMAQGSEEWKAWYKSEKPETEPIPMMEQGKDKDTKNETGDATPDLGPLTEFHQLLLLRLLRPDRLPIAMANYVNKHLALNLDGQTDVGLQQILESVSTYHTGVLVLMPASAAQTNVHKVSSIKTPCNPSLHINKLAESQGVKVEEVTVGDGMEAAIMDMLDSAERDNSWLIINDLHLASDKFFSELRAHIQRIARRRSVSDAEQPSSKFCLWFTMEPTSRIPMEMLLLLHKLSWESLESLSRSPAEDSDEGQGQNGRLEFQCGSLGATLATAIGSSFRQIPSASWDKMSSLITPIKLLVYGMGVTHGLLSVRQLFGARGMSQFYPLDGSKYIQSVEALLEMVSKMEEEDIPVQELVNTLSWGLYAEVASNPWDSHYISTITHGVLSAIVDCTSDSVRVGQIDIPVPPANVEPCDYGTWFEKAAADLPTIEGLSLHGNVDRESNDALAVTFLKMIDNLYEAQTMTLGDINPVSDHQPMNMLRLRAILDNLVENLPALLELGQVPKDLIQQEYDFPYHRPSVLSMATTESGLMPESLGFVLLQECLWMNSLLCHVRQNLHEIHNCLLSGPESFPRELMSLVESIMEEYVPASWVHPNCQPSTHSLTSWLIDVKKRHQQMHGWVKRRMIPVFRDGRQTPESHGTLRSVWLGGLVNPQALFAALRQEKAILVGCFCDEVGLLVDVSHGFNEESFDIDEEGGLYLSDLHIQGAEWNTTDNLLQHSSHDLNPLPPVYVRPVMKSEIKASAADLPQGTEKYNCPVFMNKARQVCPLSLTLNSKAPASQWTLAGTALILDTGVPEDASKKSRSFITPKAGTLTITSGEEEGASTARSSELSHEEEEFGIDEEAEEGSVTRQSERSEQSVASQSQLSYKAMSPQASPLPPELQMTRERPMMQGSDPKSSHGGSQHSLSQSSKEKSQSKESLSKPSDLSKSERYDSKDSVSRKSDRSKDERYDSKDSISRKSDRSQGGVASQKGSYKDSPRNSEQHRTSKNSLDKNTTSSQKDPTSSPRSLKSTGRRSDYGSKGSVSSPKSGPKDNHSIKSGAGSTKSGSRSVHKDSPRGSIKQEETASVKSGSHKGSRQSSLKDFRETEQKSNRGGDSSPGGHSQRGHSPDGSTTQGRHSPGGASNSQEQKNYTEDDEQLLRNNGLL